MGIDVESNPKVSVVIPTYNSANLLPRAVASVLSQSFEDYEVIVVDDGSSDETSCVVDRYGDRVRYVRQENQGAASARNHGISLARGEYIAFLDADDAWQPDKLFKQVRFLDEHPEYMMVFSDMSHYEHDVKVHESYLHERKYKWVGSGKIFYNLLHECFIFTPTVMVRKACLSLVGLFDVSLRTCEDVDLWMRIALSGNIGFIDEPLALRFEHDSNTTKGKFGYLYNPILMFLKIYDTNNDRIVVDVVRERLGRMYLDLGYYQFQSGQMAVCRSTLLNCFRFPSRLGVALKYIALSYVPRPILDVARRVKVGFYGRSS
ncbi:MAG: glycosyltransferase family 2 protein [Acidobacteriota bacterium]